VTSMTVDLLVTNCSYTQTTVAKYGLAVVAQGTVAPSAAIPMQSYFSRKLNW
jgi:hypothetical protein